MSEYEKLELNTITYEWVEKTTDIKCLKKALKLLKDDGGFFPDLEKTIDLKLQTLDIKYRKHKENEKVSQEEIDKCKEEILKFEEEFNKKDKIIKDTLETEGKNTMKNIDIIKLQRKQEAENEKIKGNELMKTKEYDEAIRHYNKSIDFN